jgi:hypothetical protein
MHHRYRHITVPTAAMHTPLPQWVNRDVSTACRTLLVHLQWQPNCRTAANGRKVPRAAVPAPTSSFRNSFNSGRNAAPQRTGA